MAKKKKKGGTNPVMEQYRIISLRQLCLVSGFSYFKLYNNLNGGTKSMDINEKTVVANAAHKEVKKLFEFLGFKVRLERRS